MTEKGERSRTKCPRPTIRSPASGWLEDNFPFSPSPRRRQTSPPPRVVVSLCSDKMSQGSLPHQRAQSSRTSVKSPGCPGQDKLSHGTARRPTGPQANRAMSRRQPGQNVPNTPCTNLPSLMGLAVRCGLKQHPPISQAVRLYAAAETNCHCPLPTRRRAGWKTTSISAQLHASDNTHRLGGNCRARTKCPNRRTAQRTQIPRTSVESGPRHNRDKMSRISPRLSRCSVGQTRLGQNVRVCHPALGWLEVGSSIPPLVAAERRVAWLKYAAPPGRLRSAGCAIKETILKRPRSPYLRNIGASLRRAGDAQKDCV